MEGIKATAIFMLGLALSLAVMSPALAKDLHGALFSKTGRPSRRSGSTGAAHSRACAEALLSSPSPKGWRCSWRFAQGSRSSEGIVWFSARNWVQATTSMCKPPKALLKSLDPSPMKSYSADRFTSYQCVSVWKTAVSSSSPPAATFVASLRTFQGWHRSCLEREGDAWLLLRRWKRLGTVEAQDGVADSQSSVPGRFLITASHGRWPPSRPRMPAAGSVIVAMPYGNSRTALWRLFQCRVAELRCVLSVLTV
jgi:hypothetical protein